MDKFYLLLNQQLWCFSVCVGGECFFFYTTIDDTLKLILVLYLGWLLADLKEPCGGLLYIKLFSAHWAISLAFQPMVPHFLYFYSTLYNTDLIHLIMSINLFSVQFFKISFYFSLYDFLYHTTTHCSLLNYAVGLLYCIISLTSAQWFQFVIFSYLLQP